jgi:hypothetical protein
MYGVECGYLEVSMRRCWRVCRRGSWVVVVLNMCERFVVWSADLRADTILRQ